MKLLLENKVKIEAANKDGVKPLNITTNNGYLEVVDLQIMKKP